MSLNLLLLSSLSFSAFAQEERDEYSFDWLDPEKKIYVLQNRRYVKTNHAIVSVMGGPGLNGTYQSRFNLDTRLAYYFGESWGVEGFYTKSFNTENNEFKALKEATTTLPLIRKVDGQLGLLVHWVPWYAKINVFNQILYFDWYFSGGLGNIQTALDTRVSSSAESNFVNETYTGFYLGTGHIYHLGERFLVRLDITGSFFKAPIFGNTGEETWFSNYNFGAGIGIRL